METVNVGILYIGQVTKPCYAGCFESQEKYGVNLFAFTISDVDRKNKTINGRFKDENGKTYRKIVGYPHVVCNQITYTSNPTYRDLKKHAKFTRSILVRDKIAKYKEEELSKSEFSDLVIPHHRIQRGADDILDGLKTYGEVIIKPIASSLGLNVNLLRLDKEENRIYFKNEKGEKSFSADDINENLTRILKRHKSYILQPFRESVTKENQPFDIRVFARRGRDGDFVTTAYTRVGRKDTITSNITRGFGRPHLDVYGFLKENFGEHADKLMLRLDYIRENLPRFYQSLYGKHKLVVIGIDLGVAQTPDGPEFVMYEINMQTVGANAIPEINAEAMHGYFRYLYEELKSEQEAKLKAKKSKE